MQHQIRSKRSDIKMRTRQWRRLFIAIAMTAAITTVGTGGVAAHARLTASDPADKATLAKAPTQIALTFSEETSATKSGGSVTDASGATVSTGFKVDLNQRTKMTIDLKPNLPNGAYTVKWNSLTEDDNGMADGTFTFTVQAAATGTGTTTTGTAPASGSAAAGTASIAPTVSVATAAPTTTAAAITVSTVTIAPTATRPAATPAATGTGGGTTAATAAPATLPKTGNRDSGSGAPWAIVIVLAAVLAVASGFAVRLRTVRRS